MTDEQEYSHIYKALEDAEKMLDSGFPATDVLIVLIHNSKSGALLDVISTKKDHEERYIIEFVRQLHSLTLHPLIQNFLFQKRTRLN
jgi:hypothetical protein